MPMRAPGMRRKAYVWGSYRCVYIYVGIMEKKMENTIMGIYRATV